MAKLDDVLKGKSSVAVSGHIRPDGDCIGSCLGVYNYIKNNYPSVDVDVYLQSFSDKFNFIRYSDEVKHDKTDKIYDLFIMLDSSSLDRLGEFTDMFNNAKETICIDHHISNEKYAMENIVFPKASSTCEVLYGLMDEDRIDNHISEALYMGIVHDSGAFKYSNTSAQTMNIAGKLMEKGIPFTSIIDNTFYTKTYVQNQILGRALLESVLFFDEKCIFSVVTQREMDFYNISYKDLIYLCQLRPGSLYVDGRKFEKEEIIWNVGGKDFTAEEMVSDREDHWAVTEPATIKVKLDGGLEQGFHDLVFGFCFTSSYMPPIMQEMMNPDEEPPFIMPEFGHHVHTRRLLIV